MDKKYIMIGGVALVIAAIIYLMKKKQPAMSAEEQLQAEIDATQQSSGAYFASQQQANVAAVTDDMVPEEDREYNRLCAEYRDLTHSKVDPTWTMSQIQEKIDTQKAKNKKIEEVKIAMLAENGGTEYSDTQLSKMGLDELTNKVAELGAENQKIAWQRRKKEIENIIPAFKTTVEDRGNAFANKPWNTGVLTELLNLNTVEKTYANQYFRQVGGAKSSPHYGDKLTQKLTIADAIDDTKRAGCSLAQQVKKAYLNLKGSVNDLGVIV